MAYKNGITTIKKTGSTALTGDLTLTGGSNVTITQAGNDLSIAATGGTLSSPAGAVIATSASYALDRFNIHPERWVHSSGGSNAIQDGVMTLTTPASNDSIVTRTLWTAILQDFDTITFDVNFNGNTLLAAGDTPLLSFDQAGDRGIVLTNFATNGVNGWQTISLPLAKFTSTFDATTDLSRVRVRQSWVAFAVLADVLSGGFNLAWREYVVEVA